MMQEQRKVVFSATFAEEMKNMRDAQFTGLPESEAMGRVRSVLESKGVYMSAESVQEIVRAAQAEREPYTYCCIHAAQPKQAKGGADGDHVERLRSLVKSVAGSEIPEMEDYSEAARRFFAEESTKESGA